MKLDFLFNNKGYLFVGIFLLNILLYFHSYNAGFVTDFTGLQEKLETQDFFRFIQSYDYPIVQPLLQLFNAVFYFFFKINPLAWFLYYVLLHSVTAFLLLLFSNKLLSYINLAPSYLFQLAILLVFLSSPYHPEVLTWRISTAFLWSGIWILLSLLCALKYFEDLKVGSFVWFGIANLCALLTFEWGLIVLPLSILIAFFYYLTGDDSQKHVRKFIILISCSVGLTAIYFILNYLSFGSILAHYGAEVHMDVQLGDMYSNVWKYLAKHLFLSHYFEYPSRHSLYSFIDLQVFRWISLSSVAALSFYLGYKTWKQKHKRSGVILLLILMVVIALIPVSNLSFEYLFRSENDRYGYIASLFISVLIPLLLLKWKSFFSKVLLTLFIIFSFCFQQKMMQNWNMNSQVFWGLMQSFDANDSQKVYALNVPDNLGGTFLFRDFSGGSSFEDGLEFTMQTPFDGSFIEVCQYNMLDVEDGVRVEQMNDSTLQVSFNQFGNWFWKRGRSHNYETEDYKVVQGEGHYKFIRKDRNEEATYIYQDGPVWKSFVWQ